jgi:hypothetical protein
VYRPQSPQLESPKSYLHPIRTLDGEVVSLFRPHDHVRHKGTAWWLRRAGTRRASRAASVLVDDTARKLTFETAMTNVSGGTLAFGSPTTKGRDNAGYGELFWRGPRSFTGGVIQSPSGTGGDELRGTRAEWMAFRGRHDGSGRSSTVVLVDDPANPRHPPQWFCRTEEFACLNPAPFFGEELDPAPAAALRFRYAVVVASGDRGEAGTAELAASDGAGRIGWVRPSGLPEV